jgi:hypothetical protein
MSGKGSEPAMRLGLGSGLRLNADPDYPGPTLIELLDQLRDAERSAAVRRWRAACASILEGDPPTWLAYPDPRRGRDGS